MNTTQEIMQETQQGEQQKETVRTPDKEDYMQRILSLKAEDQAFLDGYLFAKVTEGAKKRA